MDKDSERIARYHELPEVFQNLYGSPQSGERMRSIFTMFELPEERYSVYAEIVGDTILGFNKLSDMPRLLQQKLNLGADLSQRITSRLVDFLTPVVRREEEEARAKKAEMEALRESVSAAKATPVEDAAVNPVAAVRTMESDINRVHGYGAYREAQTDADDVVHRSTQEDILISKKDGDK
jgi:hypothetical protein